MHWIYFIHLLKSPQKMFVKENFEGDWTNLIAFKTSHLIQVAVARGVLLVRGATVDMRGCGILPNSCHSQSGVKQKHLFHPGKPSEPFFVLVLRDLLLLQHLC